MASGPSVPSARPARSRPLPIARPGALLTAAAAVPLGAAVLYAAGLLDWLPRLILGAALVVLGTAIRRTEGTVTGARIGPRTARAIGIAVVVGGAAVLGGALVAAVVDGDPDADWASLLLWVAIGVAGAWVARERPVVGGIVTALAAGVGWLLLLTLLGLGAEAEILLTVVPAAGLTAVAVRGGGSPAVRAGLGAAAATLLVPGTGELTGISFVLSGLVESPGTADPADGWLIAQAVLSDLLLGVLLATAVVRRDAVGGGLAAAGLLLPSLADDRTLRIAHAVIPVVALVLLSVAVRSERLRGWLTARAPAALRERGWNVSLDVARGAWSVSLVVLVASLWVPDTRAQAALAAVALLVAAWAAWSSRGTAAAVAAAVTVVGWAAIRPLATLLGDGPWLGGSDGDRVGAGFRVFEATITMAVLEVAVIAAIGVALLARHRAPAVAAAVVYAVLVAGAAASVAGLSSDERLLRIVIASVGLSVIPLVVAAGCAAVGPVRWLIGAQAVAAASAGATMVGLFALPSSVLGVAFISPGDGLDGTARLVLVLVLVGTAFGGALLAASTARRGSTAAALGAVAAAIGTATLAATLSAALVGPSGLAGPIDQTSVELHVPLAPVLGFDWHGALLAYAEPGWPVIFGVGGAVLLAAAAWLESRRPVPAGAPVAPRDQ